MMDPLRIVLDQAMDSVSRFPENSRYHRVPTKTMELPDGNVVAVLGRRFIPQPESLATLTTHTVVAGDRLDNLAARYYGDPLLFWQICDGNRAMRPAELTENPPSALRRLRITLPAGVPGQNRD